MSSIHRIEVTSYMFKSTFSELYDDLGVIFYLKVLLALVGVGNPNCASHPRGESEKKRTDEIIIMLA